MTDITTRERVAAAMVGCLIEKFRSLPDHTREWWLKRADAALAAMQPPPETRWRISDVTWQRWLYLTDRVSNRHTDDLHDILPYLLRDFADGVSDEVLIAAWAKTFPTKWYNVEALRRHIRALADQEEGK